MDQEILANDNYHLISEYLGSVRSTYDDEAQMVVTDAFLRAIKTYDSSRSSFKTYFYICARNARSSLGRRREAEPSEVILDSLDSTLQTTDMYSYDLESDIVDYIYRRLGDRDREVLELSVAGYKQREIAELYGVSRQSISKRLKNIRKMLLEGGN